MTSLFILLQRILPQHLLSRLVGKLANADIPVITPLLIRAFVLVYDVDLSEACATRPGDYHSFNDFFTRALRHDARTIAGTVSSPADGMISMLGDITGGELIQAKGITYSLSRLLAGVAEAPFVNGSYATIYLAPRNYHRVHVPVACTLTQCRYVPGRLFSVNRATTTHVDGLFAANERLVMRFDTPAGGMCIVMVGAMIVAGIRAVWRDSPFSPGLPSEQVFDPPRQFNQGAELATFELGSTVIVLFEQRQAWQVAPDDAINMGQPLA